MFFTEEDKIFSGSENIRNTVAHFKYKLNLFEKATRLILFGAMALFIVVTLVPFCISERMLRASVDALFQYTHYRRDAILLHPQCK